LRIPLPCGRTIAAFAVAEVSPLGALHDHEQGSPGPSGRAPPRLAASDLARLAAEPSAENRADIAQKVSAVVVAGRLSPAERSLANAIFAVLARDAAILVRRRLAESLSYHADPPDGVMRQLVFDAIEVAGPLLEASPALSDGDLIAVIDRCPRGHARAIARRPAVSGPVSNALAATGDEDVIADLLDNAGAAIVEPTYHLIVDTLGSVPRIMDLVSLRQILPAAVDERVVVLVSEDARRRLLAREAISPAELDVLMLHAREMLLLTTALVDRPAEEIAAAVRDLHAEGRLTPTLVLRAACVGNFAALAAALGCFSGIRHDDALRLLVQPRDDVCDRLYERCALPPKYRALFCAVMTIARRYVYKGDKRERGPFQTRVHRWGARVLGVPENRIGFEQVVTRLLRRAATLDSRALLGTLAWE